MKFDYVTGGKTSKIIGVMLQHSDGDKEYYNPNLSRRDEMKIFEILEKYGDNNESKRGDLAIIDLDDQYLPF